LRELPQHWRNQFAESARIASTSRSFVDEVEEPAGIDCAATMYNRAGMGPARHRRFGAFMPSLEERVSYLEGRLQEPGQKLDGIDRLDTRIGGLDGKLDTRINALDAKINALDAKMNRLDAKIDAQIARLDTKIDALAHRLDSRIDALDAKISRQFTWLAGMQVATLLAIVGALIRTAR
jgi:tetrahydromethanopterin S-methyltransferase subunit B